MAIADRKPANINLIPPRSDDSDEDGSYSFFHRTLPRRQRESTPLHYASLLGNMKIVELLLKNGAEWTKSDGNDLLPENYASVNGNGKMQAFKRLCEEEESRRPERLAEEEELRQAAKLAEEEELRWAGMLAEALESDREKQKPESERLKNQEGQKGRNKKNLQGGELRQRQGKWFFIVMTTSCIYGFLLILQQKEARRRRRRNFTKTSYARDTVSSFRPFPQLNMITEFSPPHR